MPLERNPAVAEPLRMLKAVHPELAYLALLTRAGLKPLSRWEEPLDEPALAALRQMGLLSRQVPRTVATGKELTETVFAVAEAPIELYVARFAGRPVDKSPQAMRIEGFLFGYPPCCIEQYARRPYAPNDLPESIQRRLFHWACPGCVVTALLIAPYERLWRQIEQA
jgi:hypothetical protein